MKSYIFILMLLLLIPFTVNSQQLLFETGKSITSFDYHNSNDDSLDNLQATNQTFMTVGFRQNVFTDYIFVSLGLNYNTYGAIGSDDSLNNYMEWESTHVGIYAGLDFKVVHIKKMEFFIRGTLSPEFIVQGTQTFNNQVYNLVDADDFDKTIFFFRAGLFATYPINEQVNFYIQYMGGKSKTLRESVAILDQESLRFVSHNFGFGILLKLNKKQ